MKTGSRGQRWLKWRNVELISNSATTAPICPAYGCVQIVGYEVVGGEVILNGMAGGRFEGDPDSYFYIEPEEILPQVAHSSAPGQGALWNHAFNGECSVSPGNIGHCTFDLPTWAATKNSLSDILTRASTTSMMTIGVFTFYGAIKDRDPNSTQPRSDWAMEIGEPWRIECASIIPNNPYFFNEAGWNILAADRSLPSVQPLSRAWIGGTRTFGNIFDPNANEK
jgi:hypothetical protein